MKSLILTGGRGTRLWPLSSPNRPKQFLQLLHPTHSLLQQTIERHLTIVRPDDILLIGNQGHKDLLAEQIKLFPSISVDQILAEPAAKNTLPAIIYAIKHLIEHDKASLDDVVWTAPCDHYIFPWDPFSAAVQQGKFLAEQGYLVTIGIPPSRPETGYGYIECRMESPLKYGFAVERFIEKPSLEAAQKFIQSNAFLWNCGVFLFSIRAFLEAVKRHAPAFAEALALPLEAFKTHFSSLPSISIDYGIMEKARNIAVIPVHTHWSDIGAFDQLYSCLAKDEKGNAIRGDVRQATTQNCLILGSSKPIIAIGVEGLVIIDSPEGLLVLSKEHAQAIKNVMQ